MSKLVWGAGFNDKTRPVSVDGKKVKEYGLWQDMLTPTKLGNLGLSFIPLS